MCRAPSTVRALLSRPCTACPAFWSSEVDRFQCRPRPMRACTVADTDRKPGSALVDAQAESAAIESKSAWWRFMAETLAAKRTMNFVWTRGRSLGLPQMRACCWLDGWRSAHVAVLAGA